MRMILLVLLLSGCATPFDFNTYVDDRTPEERQRGLEMARWYRSMARQGLQPPGLQFMEPMPITTCTTDVNVEYCLNY